MTLPPAPANVAQYSIITAAPAAGGSATITYDVAAKNAGTYHSLAAMTSDQTPGTTQVLTTLTATHP